MTAKEVGEKITYFREKNKMTKNALANQSGVSPTYINDLESGRKCPTVETLSFICQGLNISLSTFFSENIFNEKLSVDSLSYNQKQLLNDFLKSL